MDTLDTNAAKLLDVLGNYILMSSFEYVYCELLYINVIILLDSMGDYTAHFLLSRYRQYISL